MQIELVNLEASETEVLQSITIKNGERSEKLNYILSERAEERMRKILSPFDATPFFYFNSLNYGNPPPPWALLCLDTEYDLANYAGPINFCPYKWDPAIAKEGYRPKVGTLIFFSKAEARQAAQASPLLQAAWQALSDLRDDRTWLLTCGLRPSTQLT
jgi:hypothetical protein